MTQTQPAPQALPVAVQQYALPTTVGARVAVVGGSLEQTFHRIHSLEGSGVSASACSDIESVLAFFRDATPDLVIVDTSNSSATLARLVAICRQATDAPLLAIGSTGAFAEMSQCMEAGADDYCTGRVAPAELILRVRALLRRSGAKHVQERPRRGVVRIGALEIDSVTHTVRKAGRDIALSPTEFRLLATLAERAGEIVPSRALIARVWGSEYAEETHYLRLYVRYLRQKLEDDPSKPEYIVNRWGSGYALTEPSRAA